jgi:hypothetical protein
MHECRDGHVPDGSAELTEEMEMQWSIEHGFDAEQIARNVFI